MAEERFQVARRTVLGKKVGRLRRAGILPGVVYGHGESIPVELTAHDFELGYRRWGRTTLITLTGVDGDIPALVHAITRSPRTGKMLHVDFFRVSLTEVTSADVPLRFVGESNAVKLLNGVLLHQIDALRVEALPQDMPHRIDVDLGKLETMDDAIFVRDVVVDAAKARILNDADELVVKVVPPRAEEVAPAAPAAEEAPVAEGEVPEGEAIPAAQPAAAGQAPAAPGKAAPTPGGKAAPTPGGKPAPTPGGKAAPTPRGKPAPTTQQPSKK